jgi:hypothetical protein
MNYQKIHDNIIFQAKNRPISIDVYYENHHILPKCEGGLKTGETVKLTLKEHRLIHLLRYKITGVFGNINAFNWMTQSENAKRNNSIEAAKISHKKFKERDPQGYYIRQKNSGIIGGNKAFENKKGFYSIPEEEMVKIRLRGVKTIVDNKLGMFSDEYREKHKLTLMKSIMTPDGIFNSMLEASKHFNVVPATITYRVNSKNEKWYYLTKEDDKI